VSRSAAAPRRLLVDIGNSRLKWCLLRGAALGRQHVASLEGTGTPAFAQLARAARGVDAILAVSVAGSARERLLRGALRAAGLPAPRFVRSTAGAAGVRNGYREPWRLGVDRWVAAIGAWHAAGARRPVCVVDIGTATTVDVVDARGRHHGGLIAPGPALMQRALLWGTRGIAVRARGSSARAASSLGRDTGAALRAGALQATAALIERAAADARRRHGPATRLYLTGGGAAEVRALLRTTCLLRPNLVLRGLAVLAHPPSSSGPRRTRRR
jgi:type III pantothenate kinase